jgi:hypothetical protein
MLQLLHFNLETAHHDWSETYGVIQPPQEPRLLDRVFIVCRRRHFSIRTEQSYIHWIKRFIFFHLTSS